MIRICPKCRVEDEMIHPVINGSNWCNRRRCPKCGYLGFEDEFKLRRSNWATWTVELLEDRHHDLLREQYWIDFKARVVATNDEMDALIQELRGALDRSVPKQPAGGTYVERTMSPLEMVRRLVAERDEAVARANQHAREHEAWEVLRNTDSVWSLRRAAYGRFVYCQETHPFQTASANADDPVDVVLRAAGRE